jgi:starch phosphorylase
MVKHTLSSLGPKVLATRMVADYVNKLYVPAAAAERTATIPFARDVASFKERMRAQWPAVRVEHVEPIGVSDSPQVGDDVGVRAFVSLGAGSTPRTSTSSSSTDACPVGHADRPGDRAAAARRGAGAGPAPVRGLGCGCAGRGRSATPSACLPHVEGEASASELGLVTNAS